MNDKYRDRNGRREPFFSDDPDYHREQSNRPRDNTDPQGRALNPHTEHNSSRRQTEDEIRNAPQRPYDQPARQDRPSTQDQPRRQDRNGRHDHNHFNNERQRYPFEFHGKTGEYFKIWIVNIFLTIITLYIYSAWAKVRTKRYFYGSTTVDGSSFEYHATGKQLIVGRLIAAALLIVYTVFQDINMTVSLVALGLFAVMFPWALWRSLKFNSKASSFRNIRFAFDGAASTPYSIILIVPILISIILAIGYFVTQHLGVFDFAASQDAIKPMLEFLLKYGAYLAGVVFLLFFLIIPALHKYLISYSHNNHRYGVAPFSAKIKTSRIYGIYVVAFLLLVGGIIVFGAITAGIVMLASKTNPSIPLNLQNNQNVLWQIITAAIGYAFIIAATGVSVAYFRSAIRNHRYNATEIQPGVFLESSVKTRSLWWLNTTNQLMIIFSLGLAYPYTKIRTARYFASHTSVSVRGDLNTFTANEKTRLHAMGEEMADAFDVEFDIGI